MKNLKRLISAIFFSALSSGISKLLHLDIWAAKVLGLTFSKLNLIAFWSILAGLSGVVGMIFYPAIESFFHNLLNKKNQLQLTLLPTLSQLNLHNNGTNDVYLWGTKFANLAPKIENTPGIISPKHYYYFLTDILVKDALGIIPVNDSKLELFEVYLSDIRKNKFIAKYNLLIQNKEGNIVIHTQQLGISKMTSSSRPLF